MATINVSANINWAAILAGVTSGTAKLDSATSYTVTDSHGDAIELIGTGFQATTEFGHSVLSSGHITGFKVTSNNGATTDLTGTGFDFDASSATVQNAFISAAFGDKSALIDLLTSIPVTIDGSTGNDFLVAPPGGGAVNGGNGFDILDLSLLAGSQGDVVQTVGAKLKVTTSLGADGILGTADDTFTMVTGVELIRGTFAADTFHAAGAVQFVGSQGADSFIGDASHVLTVNYQAEELTHPGFNGSHVWGTKSGEHGVTVNLSGVNTPGQSARTATDTYGDTDTFTSVGGFNVIGTDAADTLTGNGHGGTFNGEGGNDKITGGNGVDVIYGGSGADILDGAGGNDTINGGAGNDFIVGAAGDDTLTGGAGADTFVYHAGFGKDKITDFTAGAAAGHDTIQIDHTLLASFAAFLHDSQDSAKNNGLCVITIDPNDTISLNVHKAALVAADFKFV